MAHDVVVEQYTAACINRIVSSSASIHSVCCARFKMYTATIAHVARCASARKMSEFRVRKYDAMCLPKPLDRSSPRGSRLTSMIELTFSPCDDGRSLNRSKKSRDVTCTMIVGIATTLASHAFMGSACGSGMCTVSVRHITGTCSISRARLGARSTLSRCASEKYSLCDAQFTGSVSDSSC